MKQNYRISRMMKTALLVCLLTCLSITGVSYASMPTPKVIASDNLEAMKQELTARIESCMAYFVDLREKLQDKADESGAPELYERMYQIEAGIYETHSTLMQATTEMEFERVRSHIEEIEYMLSKLSDDVEAFVGSNIIKYNSAEGVELNFVILSEENKTVQLGIGKRDVPALSTNARGAVTIPAEVNGYTVAAIGDYAFLGCSGITSLSIPASVTSLGENFLGDARNLTSLIVEDGNTVYHSPVNSNTIVRTADNTLVAACNSSILQEGIATIGSYAFSYCTAFKYLDLPKGCYVIGSWAFAYNKDIKYVIMNEVEYAAFELNNPFSISSLEAVYGRRSDGTLMMVFNGLLCRTAFAPWIVPEPVFTNYVIPEIIEGDHGSYPLTAIGSGSLSDCKIESLTIPASITLIEQGAFRNNKNLRTIRSFITEPKEFVLPTSGKSFPTFDDEVYDQATLYVPKGTKALYEACDGWKQFQNIVEMDVEAKEEESVDFSNSDINANTNLDGNIVGNLYFNISDGNGTYDPEESCIVINNATSDDVMKTLEDKEFFDSELRQKFTGIILKVPAGTGNVNITAETTGNLLLKVKVGNGQPLKMELEGKLKMSVPYDVTEESLVYIYAGENDATTRSAAAGELKIYGIEWKAETTSISHIEADASSSETVIYNLAGQRLDKPQKGVNIINGRKVVVK